MLADAREEAGCRAGWTPRRAPAGLRYGWPLTAVAAKTRHTTLPDQRSGVTLLPPPGVAQIRPTSCRSSSTSADISADIGETLCHVARTLSEYCVSIFRALNIWPNLAEDHENWAICWSAESPS